MDNMAYLQQISTPPSGKPVKKTFMKAPIFIALGVITFLILVIIIVSSFSTTEVGSREKTQTERAELRCANLAKIIKKYNKSVKSSSLRSYGNTLSGILNETDGDLKTLLKSEFGTEVSAATDSGTPLKKEEEAYATEVDAVLNDALLNAALDRNYANRMSLEITLLHSIESEILELTSKEKLKTALEKSAKNLETLKADFDNF